MPILRLFSQAYCRSKQKPKKIDRKLKIKLGSSYNVGVGVD
jgi:hypothetical protein